MTTKIREQYTALDKKDRLTTVKPWEPAFRDQPPKDYDPWEMGLSIFRKEFELQNRASSLENPHPNIQEAILLEDRKNEQDKIPDLWMTLQEIDGEPLFQYGAHVGELVCGHKAEANSRARTRIKALYETITAIRHLHEKGIVHCNISPKTIQVWIDEETYEDHDKHAILTDFSCAQEILVPKKTPIWMQRPTMTGYEAPEQKQNKFSTATDVYLFCLTAYTTLTGAFIPGSAQLQRERIRTDAKEKIGDLGELLIRGLHQDPAQRIPLNELEQALQAYFSVIQMVKPKAPAY